MSGGNRRHRQSALAVSRLVPALALLASFAAAWTAAEEVPVTRFTVSGFTVEGDNPLPAADTQRLLAGFTGEHAGVDGLLAAADALEQALAAAGFSFHRVTLPPQTLDGGTVRLRVLAFRIGEITIRGQRHFSADNVRASLPALAAGRTPDTRRLARALAVANRHPAKRLRIDLKESAQPDAVDAEVVVVDRRPWQVFAAVNNTGTPASGRSRASIGGQHANVFGRDHVLTASYTTSPENTGDVAQWGLSYQVPLYPLAANVTAFYTESDVDTGRVEQVFDVSGAGTFFGVAFEQTLLRLGDYTHGWSIGVQERLFENDVTFLNVPIGADVRSRPLAIGYHGAWRFAGASVGFYASYVRNLGGGDDASYVRVRAGAEESWDAFRFGGTADRSLPRGWGLHAEFDAQAAGEPLVAGEQLGLGGVRSVRGFEERNVAADSGLRASVELWTPALRALAGLRGFAFFDSGYKDQHDPLPGEVDTDVISGAGLGLRWQWRDWLSVALDYGRVVHEAEAPDPGNVRWHASVFLRY